MRAARAVTLLSCLLFVACSLPSMEQVRRDLEHVYPRAALASAWVGVADGDHAYMHLRFRLPPDTTLLEVAYGYRRFEGDWVLFSRDTIPAPVQVAVLPGRVLYWKTTCAESRSMRLTVQLDDRMLHRSHFPICALARQSVPGQTDSSVTFRFVAPRPIVWADYREERDTTPRGRRFEVRIWEAGADPGAVILGVAVTDAGGIRMNTLHIARPDSQTASSPAIGFSITTAPLLPDNRPAGRSSGRESDRGIRLAAGEVR